MKRSRRRRIGGAVLFLVVAVMVLKRCAIDIIRVEESSMWPVLVGGQDRVLMNRMADKPQRFEVWVYDDKEGRRRLVKRVLGFEGEHINLLGGDVWIGTERGKLLRARRSVVVVGNADSSGSAKDNQLLAQRRAALHAVYNQYLRCAADPFYTAESEDIQALLRPLFMTSWLIDDFLADNDFFGATADPQRPATTLLSSASSKTAYGTAFMLSQRQGIEVVGLTSAANVAFCESLGCYHRVLTYEQLDQLAADTPGIYVDFAGNAALRLAVHTRFAQLAYSCSIHR